MKANMVYLPKYETFLKEDFTMITVTLGLLASCRTVSWGARGPYITARGMAFTLVQCAAMTLALTDLMAVNKCGVNMTLNIFHDFIQFQNEKHFA